MNLGSSNEMQVAVTTESKILFMKKIRKASLVGASCLAFSLFFLGCSDKIQCNSDVILETVDTLLLYNDDSELLVDYVLVESLKEEARKKDSGDKFSSQLLQTRKINDLMMISVLMKKHEEDSIVGKNYKKLVTFHEEFEVAVPLITTQYKDIMTISKDKEINKVECQASLHAQTNLGNYVFNLKYNAQPTDDNEDVFVQLDSIESK